MASFGTIGHMSENPADTPTATPGTSDHETVHSQQAEAVSPFEVRTPTGTDDPLSSAEIEQYRKEINRLDGLIIDAIKRRTAISKAVGKTVSARVALASSMAARFKSSMSSATSSAPRARQSPPHCCGWDAGASANSPD